MQTSPNDGYVVQFVNNNLDRLDAIKVLFTKLDHVTVSIKAEFGEEGVLVFYLEDFTSDI